MYIYEAIVQYKKGEPWYEFRFEANSEVSAYSWARVLEIERMGKARFNKFFKKIEVKLVK